MIKDTVFSPSFGDRPSCLVGREQVISAFTDGLRSQPGNRDRAVVLLGQCGSGKLFSCGSSPIEPVRRASWWLRLRLRRGTCLPALPRRSKTTLAALSERDIDFLKAMSCDQGESSISEIARRMNATADYAQKYRKRLIDAGIICASSRGKVEFAVPYLADCLRKDGELGQ